MRYAPQILKYFCVAIILAFFLEGYLFAQDIEVSDSSLKKLSVEELVKHHKLKMCSK